MSTAPLRFVFDPTGDDLAAARQCEADVFLASYGNTPEELEREYGPYEDSTGFMAVMQEDGTAAAALRFIGHGPAGLKTLNDVSRPPWRVDGVRSARSVGVDPERTWDIATIAVRRGSGRGGLCAAALYHGIITAAFANDIGFYVMIMDAHFRHLVDTLGLRSQVLPGTKPGEYLGSEISTPLWANLVRARELLRVESPDSYRFIYQGVGLDGITLPTDWTWHRNGAA